MVDVVELRLLVQLFRSLYFLDMMHFRMMFECCFFYVRAHMLRTGRPKLLLLHVSLSLSLSEFVAPRLATN